MTALTFKDDTGYAVAGINATTTTLESAGGTVTQTGVITATTLNLQGGNGTFTLDTQNNAVTTLDADTNTLTALSFQDNSGFDVSGAAASGNITLSSTGAVTQSGVINSAGLQLLGAGGSFTLNTQANTITTLAGNTGTVLFQDNGGFAIGTVTTAGLTATVAATLTSTSTVTQSQPITTPTLTLSGTAGTFSLGTQNNAVTTLDADNSALTALTFKDDTGYAVAGINATTTTLESAGGTVTQTGVITATTLNLQGGNGTFTLDTQNNAVTTLDADTNTLTALSFQDNSGFDVSGAAASGNITLSSTGAVTQSGVINSAGLQLLGAGGSFTLNTQANTITTLAGNTGTVLFQDNGGFAIGTVTTAGLTATVAATLTSTGTVTQSQPITTPALTLTGTAGTFTLDTQNNAVTTLDADNTSLTTLSFQDNTGFDVIGATATGNITLSSTGAVTQSGVVNSAGLQLLGAGGTFTLNTQANTITTLAGNTGTVLFQDNGGFAVGTVTTAGLTATVAATLTSTGTVTQSQPITTPTLTLTGTAGTFTLDTQNNAVTTLDADNTSLSALSFQDNTGFAVAGATATGDITLSSTGAVTETGVISSAGLQLLGTGGTFTLNTQANTITTLAGNTGTVLFQDNGGFAVGTVTTAGLTATVAATLTSISTVTQSQPITTPTLTLTGTAGTFTLDTQNNAVTTLDADNTSLTALSFQDNTGFAVAGATATGDITLSSTGAVTETGVISSAGLQLLGAGGTFTLNTQANTITTLAGNTGTVLFLDNGGFAIGTVNTAGLTATVAATLTSTGTVTQTQPITTPSLTLTGTAGTFSLGTQNNAITTLDADNSALTALTFKDDSGYAVAGINATTTTLESVGGTVTQTAIITATTLTVQGAGASFNLSSTLDNVITTLDANNSSLTTLTFRDDSGYDVAGATTTGAITLISAGGTVTESAVISGTTLTVQGSNGTFNFGTQNNAVTTLDADNSSLTALSFRDDDGFAVAGALATGDITLSSTSAVTETGVINSAGLQLLGAGGTFTLNTQANTIATLAGNTGTVLFQDNGGFAVGTVTTAGLTATVAATLTSTGTVTQSQPITTPALTLTGTAGTFTLNTQNNAVATLDADNSSLTTLLFQDNTGFDVVGATATGDITLSSTSAVTESGVINSAGLQLLGAGGTFTLNTQANTIATLAGNTGTVLFQDNGGFAVGTVTTAGLTATVAATLTSTATVTQSQPITTPTLTLTGAGGTFTLNTQNNAVTTLDADNTSLNTLAFQDNTGFDVAGANATATVTFSSTGAVTESGAIITAGLQLLGAGGSYTLNTQSNAITTLAGSTGTVLFQDNGGFDVGTVSTVGLTATVGATLTSTSTVTQSQIITTPTLTLTGVAGVFTLGTLNNAVTTLDANNTALTSVTFRDDTGFDIAGANVTSNLTVTSAGAVSQSAIITGTGGLTKNGTGTMTLSSANDYTGATAINVGTLLVNGSITSNVTVTAPGILGGTNGTVTGNVSGTGTVAPGASPGILNVMGTFGIVSTLAIEINGTTVGTQYDQVNVTGGVNVTGTVLNITAAPAPAFGTTYTIINNDGGDAVTGTFAGLDEGEVFVVGASTYQITYTGGSGNDVVLTTINPAVPIYNGTPGNDAFAMSYSGGNVVTTLNGLQIDSRSVASITGVLTVNGLAGGDTLTIDFGSSVNGTLSPIPVSGLTFDGGTGGPDTLATLGGNFTLGTDTSTGAGAGTLTYTGTAAITYSNLTPIVDDVVATNYVINALAGADDIIIENSGGSRTIVREATNLFESVAFKNKTNVTVNGLGSADTITLADNSAPATGLASLNVNAGVTAGDTIVINNALTFAAGTLTLTAETISQTAGAVAVTTLNLNGIVNQTGGTMTVSGITTVVAGAAGNVTLDQANDFATIAITSGNVVDLNDTNGIILGTSTATSTFDVTAGGTITQSGVISATTLTTNSVGGTTLTMANSVTGFNATNITSGNISLTNTAAPLTITGISQSGGGNVTVNNTGAISTSGAITTAANGTISLTSSGTQTLGAVVTAGGSGTVTLAANGGTSDILVNATVSSTSGAISATAGRNVTLNAGSVTTGGNVSLTGTAGTVSQPGAGIISGALLTTSSVGGTTLGNANTVTSFNATNTTSGPVTLVNTAATLTVTGVSQLGTAAGSNVSVTNTGNLTTSGAITTTAAANGTIALQATTGVLTVGAAVTAGGSGTIGLTSTGGTNAVLVQGAVTSTSGQITVNAAGAITESGGGLFGTSGLLSSTSTTGQTLGGANAVGSFNATNTTSGDISLTNTAATLTITGISETGGNVTVNNTGAITTTGGITTAANGTISLTSSGTQTLGGVVTAGGSGTVTLTANGAASDILINAAVSSTSGAISATAGRNVSLTAAVSTTTTVGITGVEINSTAGGTITTGTGLTLTNTGTASTLNGVISGAGGVTKMGTGTILLPVANNYTGVTNVNNGTLALSINGALGTVAGNTVVTGPGILDVRNTNYALLEALSLNGGTLQTSTGTSVWTGTVDLAASSTVDVTGTQLTISGQITGAAAASLAKTGGGVLVLTNANNTYAGVTNVNFGTLFVNGTNAGTGVVNVNNSAILGGTGTITGSVNVLATSRLQPGVNGPGRLTIVDSLAFATTAFFDVELNGLTSGTQYDQVVVNNGSVDLGGISGATLTPTVGFGAQPYDRFTLINKLSAGAVSGTYEVHPEGSVYNVAGVRLRVSYIEFHNPGSVPPTPLFYGDGNDVSLTVMTPPIVVTQGVNGDLTLDGTGWNDDITLSFTGTNQLTLIGNDVSNFSGPLTSNVQLAGPYTVTGNITIKLGNGKDKVLIRGVGANATYDSGDLSIDLGSDDDAVTTIDSSAVPIATTGLKMTGNISIIGGAGTDNVTLGSAAAADTLLVRDVTIDTGTGLAQTISLDRLTATRNVTLTNGGSAAQTVAMGVNAANMVTGNLIINQTASSSSYTVGLHNTSVGGFLNVTNGSGSGAAAVTIDTTTAQSVNGATTITNGNNLTNAVTIVGTTGGLQLKGSIAIKNGTATNTNGITITNITDSGNSATNLTNGASPANTITLDGAVSNSFLGLVTATNGPSTGTNTINATRLSSTKGINLNNGAATTSNIMAIGGAAGTAAVTVTGNLVISNGTAGTTTIGIDRLTANGANTVGNVTINNQATGAGGTGLTFGANAANSISGNLQITNQSSTGTRSVVMNQTTVNGRTGVNIYEVGTGDTSLTIGNVAASTISKGLVVQDGTGSSTVNLQNLTVGSFNYADLGGGTDTVALADTAGTFRVNGVTRIDTGAGSDTVRIATAGTAILNDTVFIALGAGNDLLFIGANADSPAFNSASKFLFDGGTGNDTFNASPLSIAEYSGSPLGKKVKSKILNFETLLTN